MRMYEQIMNLLLHCDLLVLTGLILSALVGGALGAIISRPLCSFLRDAAGFLAGAVAGAGVFGLIAWVAAGF